jgi:hypothetical protein
VIVIAFLFAVTACPDPAKPCHGENTGADVAVIIIAVVIVALVIQRIWWRRRSSQAARRSELAD